MSWNLWIWCLHLLAGAYLLGFVWSWFRFRSLERAVREGAPDAAKRFNARISGFPWAFYAKMLGQRRFDEQVEGK